ncbi:MAG TPA: phosphate-starvation-inducible PsiE family protein [Ktedonobacterales bacterium]|nr:phosphate-starvation-inducible PsiE family protein [Ktedonobacterales bacterium]
MIRLSTRRGGRRAPGVAPQVKGVRRLILRLLNGLDLVVYALVGVAFVAAAALAFIFSISQLTSSLLKDLDVAVTFNLPFSGIAQDVLSFVSDLLLVLIIMELLGTIRSYVEKGDTSVEPFLIIGIISATRGILSIGARLYLTGAGAALTADEFRNAMIELAVNALVIIVLGVTIRILDGVMHLRKPDGRHAEKTHADGDDHVAALHQPEPTS